MNELRQKRKELGYTQEEAAKVCGVSRRTYQYYEEQDKFEEMRRKVLEILAEGERNRILSLYTIKLKCAEIFKKYPEVRCAYLYGSYARKEAKPESDVDILVICHKMGLSFFKMADELTKALGKEVDLQTVEQLVDNATFVENVLVEGFKIYDKRIDVTKTRYGYQIYRHGP